MHKSSRSNCAQFRGQQEADVRHHFWTADSVEPGQMLRASGGSFCSLLSSLSEATEAPLAEKINFFPSI